jgi:hypothetical protein
MAGFFCRSIALYEQARLVPVKIWPDVGAALAARLADEAIFDVGQPDIVRPLIGADRDVVAALVIRAINQDAANAGLAHLAQGDFLGPLHSPMIPRADGTHPPVR